MPLIPAPIDRDPMSLNSQGKSELWSGRSGSRARHRHDASQAHRPPDERLAGCSAAGAWLGQVSTLGATRLRPSPPMSASLPAPTMVRLWACCRLGRRPGPATAAGSGPRQLGPASAAARFRPTGATRGPHRTRPDRARGRPSLDRLPTIRVLGGQCSRVVQRQEDQVAAGVVQPPRRQFAQAAASRPWASYPPGSTSRHR